MSWVEVAGYVGAAAVPTAYSFWATTSARRRQRRVDAQKVDGEAYDRAQRINAEIVNGLRQEIGRLQRELTAQRKVLGESRKRTDDQEKHIAALQRTVDRLRALLLRNGIDIPEGVA